MIRHLPSLVLVLTLAAFLARGILYVSIGSVWPLIFVLAVMLSLLGTRIVGRKAGHIAVRVWGVVLVVYGVFRLGLAALLYFVPISSPHAMAHTGVIFAIVSALYLLAGLYLVASWRDGFSLKSGA